jgi:small neutral amino acid transporter SnatA (MarC family)
MIMRVHSINLIDAFVTFLALVGPQKVVLFFARVARTLDPRFVHIAALLSALAAAAVGVLCAVAAPWLMSFFHISTPSLQLAAGLVFFVYAVGLVIGMHFDTTPVLDSHDADDDDRGESDAPHPVRSGFREMLLPFVVSPLGVAAVLEEAQNAHGWGGRLVVAGAYAAVAALNLVCLWVLTPLFWRTHAIAFEVLSRLLGVLLAAVGVEVFLQGLTALGALRGHSGH